MADFGCTGRDRFPSAASFLRETREKRVRRGEEIRARWLDRHVLDGEHACFWISAPPALDSPSARTGWARGEGEGCLAGSLAVGIRRGRTKVNCRRGGRRGSSKSAYHVSANVFLSRPRREALSYELLPVRREHKDEERVIGDLNFASNFDNFEMGGTEESPWCLLEGADTAGGLGGSAGDDPKRKLPADTRGLIIGIDASGFDGVGFPVRGLPI